MRKAIVVGCCLMVLTLLGGAVAHAVPAGVTRSAANSQSYTSHSGPNTPNAPVISGVTASNDDAGLLTFVIHVANRPTLLPTMGARLVLIVGVKLNADGTVDAAASRDVKGYSGWLHADGSVEFERDSTAVAGASFTATYADGTLTCRLNNADIGSPTSFLFQADVFDSTERDARGSQSQDSAPTSPAGQAPYTVKIGSAPTTATTTTTAESGSASGQASGATVTGTAGNDQLTGTAGSDRLDGGNGDDRIRGGGGNDRITGGPGKDTIFGGPGDDKIFVRDGARDVVDCGPGHDTVEADHLDMIARNCEIVHRR